MFKQFETNFSGIQKKIKAAIELICVYEQKIDLKIKSFYS